MNPSKAQPTRKETVRTAVTKPAFGSWLLGAIAFTATFALGTLDARVTVLALSAFTGGSVITVMAQRSK